jgi:hypothetical protein
MCYVVVVSRAWRGEVKPSRSNKDRNNGVVKPTDRGSTLSQTNPNIAGRGVESMVNMLSIIRGEVKGEFAIAHRLGPRAFRICHVNSERRRLLELKLDMQVCEN